MVESVPFKQQEPAESMMEVNAVRPSPDEGGPTTFMSFFLRGTRTAVITKAALMTALIERAQGIGKHVMVIERARKRLSKRAKKGFRGWPLATVALYGPDDTMATKLTVGIVPAEDAEATDLRRWLSKDQTDIRDDIPVAEEVLAFITEAGVKSVVMTERIIGCPHEEGIDYEGATEGATCPVCPFWAGRDRWTGKRLH